MSSSKPVIITFKADEGLGEALRSLPNRSAFIRSALLAALDSICPLCQGSGMLSVQQKAHWQAFAEQHRLAECGTCHEWHLVCGQRGSADPHAADST